MVIIGYALLLVSLALLIAFLLYKGKSAKMKLAFLGFILFYFLFIMAAFVNYKSSLNNFNQIKKDSQALEKSLFVEPKEEKKQQVTETPKVNTASQPIKIEPHTELQGKVGQKLVVSFTVTNNTAKDIDFFKIVLEKPGFSNYLVISAVNPRSQIVKNTFVFEKLAAGSTQTYDIETYPAKNGTYETSVSFKDGEVVIKDSNGNDVKDNLKVTIQP